MRDLDSSERHYCVGSDKLKVVLSNYGASIVSLKFCGRELTLGFDSKYDRIQSGTYSGAVIGRVANRIADGKFTLNGTTYYLTRNEWYNTLHGGNCGFDQIRYFAETDVATERSLAMTGVSPDGDQGFPGKLTIKVRFSVKDTALSVEISGVSNKDTVFAPTIHPYFHLSDLPTEDDTYLQINADSYTPTNSRLIPTGEILPMNRPLDFREAKQIGRDVDADFLKSTSGYDHNYVLRNDKENCAAMAFNKTSGVKMELFTDMPGLQFYSGNFLKGAGEKELFPRQGFALEPQFFPNAVRIPAFAQPLLRKGKEKSYHITYKFSTLN